MHTYTHTLHTNKYSHAQKHKESALCYALLLSGPDSREIINSHLSDPDSQQIIGLLDKEDHIGLIVWFLKKDADVNFQAEVPDVFMYVLPLY